MPCSFGKKIIFTQKIEKKIYFYIHSTGQDLDTKENGIRYRYQFTTNTTFSLD